MMHNYDEYKGIAEHHLLDYLPQVDAKARTIYDSMKYSVMSGGKRLRPVLLLAACEYAGGETAEALPYACAIEYIHTYSLIHDDLPAMDNDDLRRGNPTNHKIYGEAVAILAGDGLLNTAFETLFRNLTYYFDDPKKLKRHISAALIIAKAAGVNGMIAGQLADVENECRECSIELVDFIDENKTGALLKAPILAGLILAGADEPTILHFASYAECIGKAFQVSDDILDVVGTEKELGKTIGKDSAQGKANYALVNGIEAAEKELHRLTVLAKEALEEAGGDTSFFEELADQLEKRRS